jgi:class 3 adenylate cyclase/tetratricopeptide (TPR) repeat protein
MNAGWLSYVPRHVAADILAHPEASPVGREQRFEAVVLFADVSGFTAISEALARNGRSGAEELTAILNSYFAPMIALVESYGGIIGKFGGDAITVLFPTTQQTRSLVACRALQCALDMQAAMGRYAAIPTSAGVFGLAMKAGLGMGEVFCTSVGDPAGRLEYVIAGPPLDECADAEHHANKGEVVASLALLAVAGEAQIAETRGAFALVAGLERRPDQAALPALPLPDERATALLAAYLHPSIAERLGAGLSGFINEHRKVTVLFIRFAEQNYVDDPQIGQRLQRYLGAVLAIVRRYDGYLNKVDMGDKGSKYIVLFGAPVIHEDDEERALRCALELVGLPDMPARVGVNSGFVYCGQVGSPARQEYTVMGDPVNLAARLMQAAPEGQVLVSGETWQAASQTFAWKPLDPIRVKGKRDPIPVYTLRGLAHPPSLGVKEPHYSLPIVGRQPELRAAAAALERASAGQGQIIALSGEAGLGKSRLAAEIVGAARRRGLRVLGGACQSYGTTSSYLVWHDVWRGFFGIDPTWSTLVQRSWLEDQLGALDPRLLPRMPLLGPALNLAIPDSPLTAGLEPGLRVELLRALLLECLRLATRGQGPLLLVLEDCHWIDPLAQELLEYIGRNLAGMPLALLVLFRPPTLGERGVVSWGAHLPHLTALELRELEAQEADQLLRLKLDQLFGREAAAPPALVERVAARAQGNPFYIEEMLNYIRDRGVDPGDAEALEALDLPGSLHSLILSRIDQLSEDAKTTLKVASVVGRLFRASWLWECFPQLGSAAAVLGHLRHLSRLDLTPLEKPEPDLEYLFKHITTQEVAYESLAFATRAELHELVGAYVERAHAEQVPQLLDVLAYHFGRGRNLEKQRHYFRLAGEAAKGAFANDTAIGYFRRLLPLLDEAEQTEALCELGEVYQLVGRWGEAEEAFRRGLTQAEAGQKVGVAARCRAALGDLLANTESYDEALSWLEQALVAFDALGDRGMAARTLQRLSFAHVQRGEHAQALVYAQRQLAIAEALDDHAGVAAALANIGLVCSDQGDLEQAHANLARALAMAGRAGDRRGATLYGGDLAGVYWQRGDYRAALLSLQEAISVASEIGYLQPIGFMAGNAGVVYWEQGEHTRALACFAYGLRIAAELGDAPTIAQTLGNLALVYLEQRHYEQAEAMLRRAAEQARALTMPYLLCDHLWLLARVYLVRRRLPEALELSVEAAGIADEIGRRDVLLPARLLEIWLRLLLKSTSRAEALAAFESMLVTCDEPGEQAMVSYEIWRLDKQRAALRQQLAATYHELHASSPSTEYRRRYERLSGAALPAPPPLPPLDQAISASPGELNALMERLLG